MNNLMQFVEVFFYLDFIYFIFMMKNWTELSLTSFVTLKYDCVIKTREMLHFLLPINNSVTIEFSFLSLIISAIISSKTINILRFSP